MLPRMRAETAAPSCGGAASSWRATAAIRPWPGAGSAIPIRGVQAAALGALDRLGELTADDVVAALSTGAAPLRRRAVEAAPGVHGRGSRSALPAAVTGALDDPDPLVVVGAAWFLGERRHRPAVAVLAATATGHGDTRCREAAVAALGAIGDPEGLPAVLAALGDKPTVRRRATVALAGFDDPRVEPALRAAAGGPRLAGAPGGRGAARRLSPRRPQSSSVNSRFSRSKDSRQTPGALDHALERRVHQVHRDGGGVGQPLGHAAQQRAAAGQMDPLEHDVLGQLGRGLREAVGRRLRRSTARCPRARPGPRAGRAAPSWASRSRPRGRGSRPAAPPRRATRTRWPA